MMGSLLLFLTAASVVLMGAAALALVRSVRVDSDRSARAFVTLAIGAAAVAILTLALATTS
ncbi:hypothetical protein [Streptomyces lavendulae]|uniref:hypothetical protein n=1 Tax=Streptomyces lavendulae TaxID=1914 RepID=UPI003801969B